MIYIQMLNFHWAPSLVHHAMYRLRAVDIYYAIKLLKMSFACQFLHWFYILLRLTKSITMNWSVISKCCGNTQVRCYRWDVTEVYVFNVFYLASTTSHT